MILGALEFVRDVVDLDRVARRFEGRDPRVDGREGRKSVEIIRAIYRSAQTGARVTLPLEE
jgi:predicted dehydrogenase